MKELGILLFGETDNISFSHTVKEAQDLARQGAKYIAEHRHEPNHPVSFVGLMLDENWIDQASDFEQATSNGVMCGICYDLIFQSRAYLQEQHKRFKKPCFLFTAFRQWMNQESYSYYLRMVGITEWKPHSMLCVETSEAFRMVQKQSPIDYAEDSIVKMVMMDV